MRTIIIAGALGAVLLGGCSTAADPDDAPPGSDALEQNAANGGLVRVGLFSGHGAQEPYITNTRKVVQSDSRFVVEPFFDGSVNFHNFDVVIFPGGLGGSEWATLELQGQEHLRTFVREGGGLIGICAGYYLAIDNGFITASYAGDWQRGGGMVNVSVERGSVFTSGGTHAIDYLNGPVVWPSQSFTTLATFQGHIGGAETMVGKPAAVAATFGQGRVVGISPHPEGSGLGNLLNDAVAWAGKSSAAPSAATGNGTTGTTANQGVACDSATLGRSVPKNTCVKRTDENAWYRCGGDGSQDWRPIDWPTPALCNSCPQWGPQCPF